MTDTAYYSTAQIRARFGVSDRTVRNWIARGWLARPIKHTDSQQARCYWHRDDVAAFERDHFSRRTSHVAAA